MKTEVVTEIYFFDLFEMGGELIKTPRVTKRGTTVYDEEWVEKVKLSRTGEAIARFLKEGYGLELNSDIFKSDDIRFHLENLSDR